MKKISLLTILCLGILMSCSDPTNDDLELIDPTSIPSYDNMYFQINVNFINVKRSDGTGGFTETQLDETLVRLNQAFSGTNIGFIRTGRSVELREDSLYYGGLPGFRSQLWVEVMNQRVSTTKIDVYLYPALSVELAPGKFKADFGNIVSVGGIVDGEAAAMTNIVAHEIGHALGLIHVNACNNMMTGLSDINCLTSFDSSQGATMRYNLYKEPNLANIGTSWIIR